MSNEASGEALGRRLEAAVQRFMAAEGLWPAAGGLLLAVSGGPDSTALLLILHRLAFRRGVPLAVAHFDHGLRGARQRRAEREFVAGLAASLGLPLYTGAADVRGQAKAQRLSLEDAARRARYAFLAQTARQAGCGSVATGHTASDQAETVLLHLIRGSGLAGLAGMAAKAAWPFAGQGELTLVRPLLCLSRAETAAYCQARGVQPLQDETNLSPAFRRNRLRSELLPLLRQFNPRVEDALARLADAARKDLSQLEAALAAAGAPRATEGRAELPLRVLRDWPGYPLRHALLAAVAAVLGDRQELGQRHVLALERLARQGRTGDGLDLPRGLRAELTRLSLVIRRRAGEDARALPAEAVPLAVPGEATFGPLIVTATLGEVLAGSAALVEADAEAVGPRLVVRRRRPGDRFQPLGMAAPKKLQDFFVDAHVPRAQRDAVPLFENERGIVWVGGLRLAEWAKPRPGRPVVCLAYRTVG